MSFVRTATLWRTLLSATAGAALLAGAASARAEDGTAEAAAEAPTEGLIGGDIVVTARRRDEKSQDVPIAISAFGGAQLEATRTYNLRDVQQLTPSLVVTVTNPRNTSINIRGLGNNVSVSNDGLEPAVGVYLDGVYLARPGQAVFDLADLDHIEVLRGPQGTLFGKNTSAGAVVINTKAPSFTPEFGSDFSYGNYDYTQLHTYASGALIDDTLAARLLVSKTDRQGYTTNIHDDSHGQSYHDFSVRGQLLFTPTDRFKLRLIGDYANQHSNTAASVLVGAIRNYANGTLFANNFYDRAARIGYTPISAAPSDRLVDSDGLQNYRMNQNGVAATADLSLDWATITSVTAYRAWNWYPHNDGDGISIDAGRDSHQSNNQRQFSQELRIASDGTRRIDYVAGLYYLYQQIKAEAVTSYGDVAAPWYLAPGTNAAIGAAALNNYLILSHSSPVTNSYAAFAQTVWHVTPTIDLTTGLRYTYETKTGWFDQTATGVDISGFTVDQQAQINAIRARYGVANSYTARTSAGRLSGQATLSWKIAPPVLAYATYSRGNKFGGLNLANVTTSGPNAVNPVIGPETIDSYEAGLKTSWFGDRLTANIAAFWTDDSGYQTTIIELVRNVSYFANAGKVRTRGFEGDVRGRPARWLSLYASGSYDDARYLSYANAPCPIEVTGQPSCDLSGRRLPGVSKWAFSGGAEAHAPVGVRFGHDSEIYAGGDYSYRSNFYTNASDSIYSHIPGYGVLNLRLGVRSTDGLFDVQIWGRNLANKAYYLSLGANNLGTVTGTLGDPRTYGVTLRTRF